MEEGVVLSITLEFFGDELPEKKFLLVCMSTLTILLSLVPRCHNMD
jgi:hypothetical protein